MGTVSSFALQLFSVRVGGAGLTDHSDQDLPGFPDFADGMSLFAVKAQGTGIVGFQILIYDSGYTTPLSNDLALVLISSSTSAAEDPRVRRMDAAKPPDGWGLVINNGLDSSPRLNWQVTL